MSPLALVALSSLYVLPVPALVFGERGGTGGQGQQVLGDIFRRRAADLVVRSAAVPGTRACQWAGVPGNLAAAAAREFPGTGPHVVLLALGGNELWSPAYQACSEGSNDLASAHRCAEGAAEAAGRCNVDLLTRLYEKFPRVKVVHAVPDLRCSAGGCSHLARWPYCRNNLTCASGLAGGWATKLLMPAQKRFGDDRYEGVVLSGGRPALRPQQPPPGEDPAAEAADSDPRPRRPPRMKVPKMPEFRPVPGWQDQYYTDAEDTLCNRDWVPDLTNPNAPPPPCDRTWRDPDNAWRDPKIKLGGGDAPGDGAPAGADGDPPAPWNPIKT